MSPLSLRSVNRNLGADSTEPSRSRSQDVELVASKISVAVST
jgi:hypothetical protein